MAKKTQQTIIEALEFKEANANKLHYADAEVIANEFGWNTLNGMKNVEKATITGGLRRKLEVAESLEILVASSDFNALEEELGALEPFEQLVEESGPLVWRGTFKKHRIPVELMLCDPAHFVREQLLKTGSQRHISIPVANDMSLRDMAYTGNFDSEEKIYEALNMAYVAPELREGTFEIERAKSNSLPRLVEMEDPEGDSAQTTLLIAMVNIHLRQMAEYCKELGYEYLGICDHSKSAFYANGLNEERGGATAPGDR